jgi:ABC-2 type transport system ATP-binding protein
MDINPVIKIEKLTKYFGKVAGVKDISLEVMPGEIFGFLGPNGAGKTTTIRLILDLLRPTSGRISVFGKDITLNSFEIRQRCGYLPGNFSAYANLSAHEFLRLSAHLRNRPYVADPAMLRRFGLDDQIMNRKIKYLSHGTIQKIGIIQAFFHNPGLLILDEPTIGLDPLMQEEFYLLLKERRERGCTIFLSSHNLAEVERICIRMAIIRKGELVVVDSIENLKKSLQRRLRFRLSHPAENFSVPFSELVYHEGLTYEFIVHGDWQVVLRHLAGLPVEELIVPEPSLDEIFIQYYHGGEDD